MADAQAQERTVVCHTKLNAVVLKITLTHKFLGRTLDQALLKPFLGARNKKAPTETPTVVADIVRVTVDGVAVDGKSIASDVLPKAAHTVELFLAASAAPLDIS